MRETRQAGESVTRKLESDRQSKSSPRERGGESKPRVSFLRRMIRSLGKKGR
jgi:hypothetical protein